METATIKIPPEIIGGILSYLPPNEIKKWIVLSSLSGNRVLFKELKRTYINTIRFYSPTNYSLYNIYFKLDKIDTHGKYLLEVLDFYNIVCNNRIDYNKSCELRLNLAKKLEDRRQTKFINITKYLWRFKY